MESVPENQAANAESSTKTDVLENASEPTKRRSAWLAGAVAIGALVLEPELLPGMAIGAAVVAMPKLFPRLTARLRPMARSAWRGLEEAVARGRDKTRELGRQSKEPLGQATSTPESHDEPRHPA